MGKLRTLLGASPIMLLFVLPLCASLIFLAPGLLDWKALQSLLLHPQFAGALWLSASTGLLSTALSVFLACMMFSAVPFTKGRAVGWMLALPHLALVTGLALLIAPTGILARFVAELFTGWTTPPAWQSVRDANGFGLVAALVLKETPFLLWAMARVYAQDAFRTRLHGEMQVASSLGHAPHSVFLRILLPQIMSQIIWPLIAVLSYGLTVVDMALVIGPGQPPTLAQLVWTDLADGDPAANARGVAGTLFLAALLALVMLCGWAIKSIAQPVYRRWLTRKPSTGATNGQAGNWAFGTFQLVYALIFLAVAVQSIAFLWPFPDMVPRTYSLRSWIQLADNATPIVTTLVLAVLTSTLAVAAAVLWFETQAKRRDLVTYAAALVVLTVPSLLIAAGQYRFLLFTGLTGTATGLLLVHLVYVAAYVFIMLAAPYRAYDTRWKHVADGIGKDRWHFLTKIKWPMLKAPIFSAWAIGFAVSVAQYVPAQLASAGRYSTLPMEAIALTSGGNRATAAVMSIMLMLLPLAAYVFSVRAGKTRWSTQ